MSKIKFILLIESVVISILFIIWLLSKFVGKNDFPTALFWLIPTEMTILLTLTVYIIYPLTEKYFKDE